MRLTKREAIRECKRLWKAISESGLSKDEFLSTADGSSWLEKNYLYKCPLCEYARGSRLLRTCENSCPLFLQFGRYCEELYYSSDPKGFYRWVKKLKE